ncbi:DUF3325 domain-containing protein [Verticiella sediminum]|uniref:DUF3325 domain-containing protein n=1 Tax=Verticiella sediminum TaxID=1247510 RepID=A0A556AJM6_9BURK|nr:DUF3325 domain-containing protein [Verticiella sediminum]
MLAVLPLVFCGFALLALAMPRHADDVLAREFARGTRLLLRGIGAAALVLTLFACIRLAGPSAGATAWCGLLLPAALAVGLVLTYRPHALLWMLPVGVAVGTVLLADIIQ